MEADMGISWYIICCPMFGPVNGAIYTGGTIPQDTGNRFCRGYFPIGEPCLQAGYTEKEL